MADSSAITKIFDNTSATYKQTDKTTSELKHPELETQSVETAYLKTGPENGAKLADGVFPAGSVIVPYDTMCTTITYNMSEAQRRILTMYSMTRADFYAQAVKDNLVRQVHNAAKKSQMLTLNALGTRAKEAYSA